MQDATSKELQHALKKQVWPALRQQGFTKFGRNRAWRFSPRWTDLVEFGPVRGQLGHRSFADRTEVEGHEGTFCLTIGTHYTDKKLLPWLEDETGKPVTFPNRRIGLNRPVDDVDVPGRFYVADLNTNIENAVACLETRGYQWFEECHDIAKWLEDFDIKRPPVEGDEPNDDDYRAEIEAAKEQFGEDWQKVFIHPGWYTDLVEAVDRLQRGKASIPDLETMQREARNPTVGRGAIRADLSTLVSICATVEVDWFTLYMAPRQFPEIAHTFATWIQNSHFYEREEVPLADDELRIALLAGEGRYEEAMGLYIRRYGKQALETTLAEKERDFDVPGLRSELRWWRRHIGDQITEEPFRLAALESTFARLKKESEEGGKP